MRDFYQESSEIDDEHDDEQSALYNQLYFFHTSDQYERAISVGFELLAKDPNNAYVHSILGQSYTNLERYPDAEKHLKAAIANDPDDGELFAHLAYMELKRGRAGIADDNIRISVKLDPTSSYAWYIFGILCVHYEDFKQAQVCVDKIRTLEPESGLAEKLDVQSRSEIVGRNQYNVAEKISEHEKLLEVNPEDDFVHYQLGYLHLYETKDVKKAEFHFRKALELDPTDKDFQKGLIKSWRKRDLFLRLLWVPYLPIEWALKVCEWCNRKIWPYVFMIFLFKYIILMGIVVALVFYTLFWPIAKLYEYLTLAEIHRKMGVLKMYGGMEQVHKWQYSKRMMLFVAIALFYWGGIALATPYMIDSDATGATLTFIVFGLFIVFIILSWILLFVGGIKKARRSSKNKSLNTQS